MYNFILPSNFAGAETAPIAKLIASNKPILPKYGYSKPQKQSIKTYV
jgi:hypothetical protein